MRNIGVNRISTGIQSFDDRILKAVGATHTSEEAWQAIRNAKRDFGEVAIDLLFRCQGQSVSDFLSDIRRAIAIDHINHISLYSLVLPMGADQPSSLVEAEMTIEALNELKIAGFIHYASCATGGFDLIREGSHPCKYELRHWQAPQAEFLGIGPGALGFLGDSVTVNCLNIHRYNTELERNSLPLVSITTGSHEELMRRYFVLGVKTLEVEFESFRRQFCVDPTKLFYNELEQLKKWNFVEIYYDRMKLTELGRLFVDTVSSQFFSSNEMGVNHPEEAEIRAAEKIIYRSHTVS